MACRFAAVLRRLLQRVVIDETVRVIDRQSSKRPRMICS